MSDNTDELINGVVYKITSKVKPEMVYFGSTKNFYKRMSSHKTHYNIYLKNKSNYLAVYDIFALGYYKQEVVKGYTGITAKKRRRRWWWCV